MRCYQHARTFNGARRILKALRVLHAKNVKVTLNKVWEDEKGDLVFASHGIEVSEYRVGTARTWILAKIDGQLKRIKPFRSGTYDGKDPWFWIEFEI